MRSSSFVEHMQMAADSREAPFPVRCVPVNIQTFLGSKADNYRFLCGQKGVQFLSDIQPNGEAEAVCLLDSWKLERILDNIVFNAIRYTPEGGQIQMKARLTRDRLSIRIHDSGDGFAAEALPRLFNRQYQSGAGNDARETGHYGLGLYIARQLVELHGGAIQAYNGEHGGACVEFHIAVGLPEGRTGILQE